MSSMNVNDPKIREALTPPPAPQPEAEVKDRKISSTTASDLDGVTKKTAPQEPPKPIATVIAPAFASASTMTEVENALAKLEGKSTEVQNAVAQAAAALGMLNAQAGSTFSVQILKGLTESLVGAAKNDVGVPFDKLYTQMGKGLDELLRAAPENVPLKIAAGSARTIMDILETPGGAHNQKAQLEAAFRDLQGLTLVAQNATEDQKYAAALAATMYNVLSLASEAAVLGDKLTSLLPPLVQSMPFLLKLPDAVASSGNATNAAVLGLMMLVAAQVQQEITNRLESMEAESRLAQELLNKQLSELRARDADAKRDAEVKDSAVASASAFVSALAQCGDEGLRMVNELMLKRQADSHPRAPV